MGHVVTEEWPEQTYAVGKPTRSWVKKCKKKEEKADQQTKLPKPVRRGGQVKQERDTERLQAQQE